MLLTSRLRHALGVLRAFRWYDLLEELESLASKAANGTEAGGGVFCLKASLNDRASWSYLMTAILGSFLHVSGPHDTLFFTLDGEMELFTNSSAWLEAGRIFRRLWAVHATTIPEVKDPFHGVGAADTCAVYFSHDAMLPGKPLIVGSVRVGRLVSTGEVFQDNTFDCTPELCPLGVRTANGTIVNPTPSISAGGSRSYVAKTSLNKVRAFTWIEYLQREDVFYALLLQAINSPTRPEHVDATLLQHYLEEAATPSSSFSRLVLKGTDMRAMRRLITEFNWKVPTGTNLSAFSPPITANDLADAATFSISDFIVERTDVLGLADQRRTTVEFYRSFYGGFWSDLESVFRTFVDSFHPLYKFGVWDLLASEAGRLPVITYTTDGSPTAFTRGPVAPDVVAADSLWANERFLSLLSEGLSGLTKEDRGLITGLIQRRFKVPIKTDQGECPKGYSTPRPTVARTIASYCLLCPPGYMSDGATDANPGGRCAQCDVGKYSERPGSVRCTACRAPYSTFGAGSTSRNNCSVPHYELEPIYRHKTDVRFMWRLRGYEVLQDDREIQLDLETVYWWRDDRISTLPDFMNTPVPEREWRLRGLFLWNATMENLRKQIDLESVIMCDHSSDAYVNTSTNRRPVVCLWRKRTRSILFWRNLSWIDFPFGQHTLSAKLTCVGPYVRCRADSVLAPDARFRLVDELRSAVSAAPDDADNLMRAKAVDLVEDFAALDMKGESDDVDDDDAFPYSTEYADGPRYYAAAKVMDANATSLADEDNATEADSGSTVANATSGRRLTASRTRSAMSSSSGARTISSAGGSGTGSLNDVQGIVFSLVLQVDRVPFLYLFRSASEPTPPSPASRAEPNQSSTRV